jgi:branched-chain amino acid transport system permease protein
MTMVTETPATRTPASLPVAARPDVRRTVLLTGGGVAAAVAVSFALDPYRNYLFALVAAYFCATAGLGMLVGRTGQLSLGHAALMAAGGYGYALTVNALSTSALTSNASDGAGVPAAAVVPIGMVAGVVTAAAAGLLIGLAGARLHGPYLAGLTLTVVMALPALTAQVPALGGDQGVSVPFQAVPGGLASSVGLEQWQAWVAVGVAGVVLAVLAIVDGGPTGVRMRAVRDDEVAAALAGIAPGRTKVRAFVLSAAAAGAGGTVLCFVNSSVSPGGYGVELSLLLLVGVVVGGTGRLAGAAVGAALVVLLPWLIGMVTSARSLSPELAQRLDGNLAVLTFGVLLIVLTAVAPTGVVGALSALSARPARRRARRAPRDRAPQIPGAAPETSAAATPANPTRTSPRTKD